MDNMLSWGLDYIRQKREDFMSYEVVYAPVDGTAVHVKAAVGEHLFANRNAGEETVYIRSVDFIISESLLDAEPREGDAIIYNGERYEVGAPNGEACWSWSGSLHDSYRIHAFCKGNDSSNNIILRSDFS